MNQSGKKFILSGLNGLCCLKIIQGKAYSDRMGKQKKRKESIALNGERKKSERKEKTN